LYVDSHSDIIETGKLSTFDALLSRDKRVSRETRGKEPRFLSGLLLYRRGASVASAAADKLCPVCLAWQNGSVMRTLPFTSALADTRFQFTPDYLDVID
jgi:hypothetical protein